MSARVRFIARKRAGLVEQLKVLEEISQHPGVDRTNLTLRLEFLTKVFFDYEELHEELTQIDEGSEGLSEMRGFRDRYYKIAAGIKTMEESSGSGNNISGANSPIGMSTFIERQRLLKLPVAELPKFGGEHDKWLSFRNTFKTMVDARTDIDDLVKFFYLRNSLEGEALNKVSIFDANAANYRNAWQLLIDAYDRKRILVSKHLDALIDIKPLTQTSAQYLSKLVDDTRQHLTMLRALQVQVDDRIVVRLLERALPISVRRQWEESLTLDELPPLETFYKFINATTFKLSTMEAEMCRIGGRSEDKTSRIDKRSKEFLDKDATLKKRPRQDGAVRVFATAADRPMCPKCKGFHALFACLEFQRLSVEDRWAFVKAIKICENCLREHPGICPLGTCKRCGAKHNTSLHRELTS